MNVVAYTLIVWAGLASAALVFAVVLNRRLRARLTEAGGCLDRALAANQDLQAVQRRLYEAQRLAGLRTWEWDLEGRPETWVDQAFRLLGLISDPGGPEVSMRRIHPQDKSRLKKGVAESLLRDVPLDVTFRSIQADGTVRHLRACAQVERNTGGRPERIVGTVLDVTEFKRAEAQAWQAASIDSLTGAFARSRFFELAAHEFERWRRYRHPLAVMMIDVDDFKQFNDAFGHGFGDRVLQAVVKAIKTQLRRSDILGRYGGDEFAVALPDSTLQAARETAERLRRAVNGLRLPVSGDGDDARISISIGVAESDSDECTNIEHVLKRADRALYAAKHAGRNQVVNA